MFEEHIIEQYPCSQNNEIIGFKIKKRVRMCYFDNHR